MKAKTLAEMRRVLSPKPLRLNTLDDLFVETSQVRDPNVSRRKEIVQHLDGDDSTKILLAGHPGCGKSTELVKLRSEHSDRFAFVQLSMTEDADSGSANVEVLLVLIVEAILHSMSEKGIALDEGTLQKIRDWFAEVFKIQEKDLRYTGSTGAGLDSKEGFLGKLLGLTAYLKADIRAGSALLSKTVSREEHRLPQLTTQCGLLIKEAQGELRARGQELCLVIEDLDKVSIDEADTLFINNPAPLSSLPTKAIFTAPISLLCNPRATVLDAHFKRVIIPMIKIDEPDGSSYEAGRKIIRKILERRSAVDELVDDDALLLAITKTGGVLRHLFDVLFYAGLSAEEAYEDQRREKERIERSDVRYGLNRVKNDLIGRISDVWLPKDYQDITTDQLYARLYELWQRPRASRVKPDKVNLLLMQAQALIEYNDTMWHRVHPLVAEYLEEESPPET
jgi:hypothetical protein